MEKTLIEPGSLKADSPKEGETANGEAWVPPHKRKIPDVNGTPNLNGGGTPGNRGGGRPKSSVVQACSEGFDGMLPTLTQLFNDLNNELVQAKEAGKSLTGYTPMIREIRGILDTFGKYGPGTRVHNVVDRDEFYYAADRAYCAHDGTKLDYLERLKVELDNVA